MLQEYIKKYEAAVKHNDKKTMRRIERELSSIGMDVATLKSLVGWKGA